MITLYKRFATRHQTVICIAMVLAIIFATLPAFADPWSSLRLHLEWSEDAKIVSAKKKTPDADPWTRLQALFLPFTLEEEASAIDNPSTGKKISRFLHRKLESYAHWIEEAARRFNIPPEIIGAVIMVESGGNPHAAAKTSSARGLMQTISETFREARDNLRSLGIRIKNSPYDPYSSIMAGCWYLDRMFDQAISDGKRFIKSREIIKSWKYPVEYYYAGPNNGKKKEDTVIMYAGGRRVVIDKPAYSKKVLKWANIMNSD